MEQIAARIGRALERAGLLVREAEQAYLTPESADAGSSDAASSIEDLIAHSITYRIATGAHAGEKVLTLQSLPPSFEAPAHVRLAQACGFSLHVGIGGGELEKLERLCRYISRPALATERLVLTAGGAIRIGARICDPAPSCSASRPLLGAHIRRGACTRRAAHRRPRPRACRSGRSANQLRFNARLPMSGVARFATVKRARCGYRVPAPDVTLQSSTEDALKTLLVINSSVSGANSASRVLVEHAVAEFAKANPGARIVRRDVGEAPIPHLTAETLAGVRGTPQTESEQRTRRLSDELIAELRAADTIIIGAPMCNFGVPTGLRAWFDHVLRAGETFSYTEAGPQGLLAGKRAIVIESRGGLYSEGPAKRSTSRSRIYGNCSASSV